MKGKQAIAAARRREADAVSALTQAAASIAELKAQLLKARHEAAGKDSAVAEVTRLRANIEAGTSDKAQAQAAKIEQQRTEIVTLRDSLATLQATHDKGGRAAIAHLRGEHGMTSTEAIEELVDWTAGFRPVVVSTTFQSKVDTRRGDAAQWAKALQRKTPLR